MKRRALFTASWLLAAMLPAAELYPRNTEVPFAYRAGGERSWRLTDRPLGEGEKLSQAATVPAGMEVQLRRDGRLAIRARNGLNESLDLKVSLRQADGSERSQQLRIVPAPPDRPITYLSDLLDDLIRMFRDGATGQWRPVTRDAFDQYFRRLQAQGIRRIIVWPSAFPLFNDPQNYGVENWSRFEKQARAILEDEELNHILYDRPVYQPYQWHGLLMRFRMNQAWGRMYTESAAAHGIRLTVSYRPFEHALMKYYVIPVFDHEGRFLWNFLPGANPRVNFNPDQVSFAHYRQLLQQSGKNDHAELAGVTFAAVPESKPQTINRLRVYATKVPPIANRSFVLVRGADGEFDLRRFEELAERVAAHRVELKGWTAQVHPDGAIEIAGLKRPSDHRYLIFSGDLTLPVELPVVARSKAGSRIGRINAYWALAETKADHATSRIGGITAAGGYRTDFQAIENSFRMVRRSGKPLRPLGEDEIVIDFGADWSPEMMDYNRAAARRLAVSEIKTALGEAAFDEIFINTRSHTQLAGSIGDGELGIQTIGHHRRRRKNYFHLGIDRAYAPLSAARLKPLRALIADGSDAAIEKITNWQPGEWQGFCQSEADGFPWRYARNSAVAIGVRRLLQDLEREFPDTRIRVMIPPRAEVADSVMQALPKLSQPKGGTYDAKYYRYLRTGLNHIPAIGEGMAMLDLKGLRAEPMFLGLRDLPDPGPVKLFVDAYVANQADNHGSSYQGPKSFFYEAQYTLRHKDKAAATQRREEIIRNLLQRPEIDEVILYEAVNWAYDLPVFDPHRYLNQSRPPHSPDR